MVVHEQTEVWLCTANTAVTDSCVSSKIGAAADSMHTNIPGQADSDRPIAIGIRHEHAMF